MQKEIAKTIIDQINAAGPRFPRLTQLMGAKDFVALNGESVTDHGESIRGGLMFRATTKRGHKVIVELTFMDTYRVVVGKQHGVKWTELHRHEDIYCDQLGVIVAEDLGIV